MNIVVLVNSIFIAGAAFVLLPVIVLCVECLAALLPRRKRSRRSSTRDSVAVIIPAHNEALGIGEMLRSLLPQMMEGDRVLVVADNCTDNTAAVACEAGATVIERQDRVRKGKGFALAHAMRHLEQDPPQIIIMIDADCIVQDGAIDGLSAQVEESQQPAQAVYLMDRPANPGPRDLVSALAFMVKNLVRPTGLARMGLPCLLTGTGMAFPWKVIHRAKLASSNLVEDMQLALDLAVAGHAPRLCPTAMVTGKLPPINAGAVQQRTRWEHGHLRTLLTQVPKLLRSAILCRNLNAAVMALELAVPPLSLLTMAVIALLDVAIIAGLLGMSWLPAKILGVGTLMMAGAIGGAWIKYGRGTLPLMSLLAAPFYMFSKIPLYVAFVLKPQKEWIRTARATGAAADASAVPVGLDGGLESMDVQAGPRSAKTASAELVYQSFLSGFASEFSVTSQRGGFATHTRPEHPHEKLKHIKSIVLLGGSVRPTRLGSAIERSILDLPLEDGKSLLWHWRAHALALRRFVDVSHLHLRIMVDRASPRPIAPPGIDGVTVEVERDLSEYRGTGGVLRDLSSDYDDDDLILVANAAQALLDPLPDIASALAEVGGDVSLVSHADGTPSGLMLVRCGALRSIARTGYIDLKEQALPAIARQHEVGHLMQPNPTGLPIRTLEEYMRALQRLHRQRVGEPASADPMAEDVRQTFVIVEEGASLHPAARVHDSVILRGARVEADALVIRSIVCPGGEIAHDETAIDQLVMPEEVLAAR